MLRKLGNAIQSFGEVLAPINRNSVEEFQFQWRQVKHFYGTVINDFTPTKKNRKQDPLDDPNVLGAAKIQHHLKQMIDILCAEDREEGRNTGPCLEYFLQQRVFEELTSLGLANRPPGMRRLCIRTVIDLLLRMEHALLPYTAVVLPLNQLIAVCLEACKEEESSDAAAVEQDLVELLYVICQKLQEDPSLLQFFTDLHSDPSLGPSKSHDFVLFFGLLSHVNNCKLNGERARGGLLFLLQLPNDALSKWIVNRTNACEHLIEGFQSLYEDLPMNNPPMTSGPAIQRFEDRLHFFNSVVKMSDRILVDAFLERFNVFLEAIARPHFLATEESTAIAASYYFRVMVDHIDTPLMEKVLATFLLGDEENGYEEPSNPIRETLISRIDSLNEELSLRSMQIIESLLDLHDEHVMKNLVLRFLQPCAFLQSGCQKSIKEVGDLDRDTFADLISGGKSNKLTASPGYNAYMQDAADQIPVYMQAFQYWDVEDQGDLIPSLSRFRASSAHSSGAAEVLVKLNSEEPKTPTDTDDAMSNVQLKSNDFQEGLFLSVLMNRMERLLDHNLDSNIVMTGILAKLAQCPHPVVHSYLLDPRLPLGEGVRTLPSVLKKIGDQIQSKSERIENFEKKLDLVKAEIDVEASDSVKTITLDELESFGAVSTSDSDKLLEDRGFYEAVILVEEFEKELLSIVHTKNEIHNINQTLYN